MNNILVCTVVMALISGLFSIFGMFTRDCYGITATLGFVTAALKWF